MPYPELFAWWAISISSSIVFLTLVSVYLYVNSSRRRRAESGRETPNMITLGRNFIFVFVLIGLLFFYIISIRIGSILVFAVGNIAVEAILVAYLIRNKTEAS